jgi:hypothetical protein
MDVVASFVADAEAAVLVQPSDRALDDPSPLPSPDPCSLFGRAIFAWMPRWRSSRRPWREL